MKEKAQFDLVCRYVQNCKQSLKKGWGELRLGRVLVRAGIKVGKVEVKAGIGVGVWVGIRAFKS